MKANQKFKDEDDGYAKIVGGLLALLLSVVIGVLVYWSISGTSVFAGTTYEEFTSYADTTNASAWSITLAGYPNSASETNVTCVNMTSGGESWPTFTLNTRTISVAADAANNFTQVNVTFTSKIESDVGSTNTQAGTVFTLLPILAIVVIGGIMIAAVMRFGGGGKT